MAESGTNKKIELSAWVWLAAFATAFTFAGSWYVYSHGGWGALVARDSAARDRADDNDRGHHVHGDHDHADDEHAVQKNSIELSPAGLKNIGYQSATIALEPFQRTETMPAIVVERPGQTQFHVTAPFTGVLTKLHVGKGEAIEPGSPMFEVRLTHEELVAAQQDFLKTAESLDVIDREIVRLASLTDGVVAGRRIIEQQYEKQKLEASLRAAEQALLLHGLLEEQVAAIRKNRKLLRDFTVRAPQHVHADDIEASQHFFHVQRLDTSPGQQIEAGQELAVLADHCELYIEGRAFEDDAPQLRRAAREAWGVSAKLMAENADAATISDLRILYLSDQVDPDSRALHFYLPFRNDIALDQSTPDGRRFIEWRFKPGQRVELSVPIAQSSEQIVLPAEAIVEEGAEKFVYRRTGNAFERVAVHVEQRDGKRTVIARDGALSPGDVIAGRGAFRLHLQAKSKAGGDVDPHAGHHH